MRIFPVICTSVDSIRLRLRFVRKERYRFDYIVQLNRLDRNQLLTVAVVISLRHEVYRHQSV